MRTYGHALELKQAGLGITSITKRLNAYGYAVIAKQKKNSPGIWLRSYVAALLRDDAVLGMHQPMKYLSKKKKVKDGEPFLYYPPVITETEWHAARAGIEERKNKSGREPITRTNIFAGLLFDARSGVKLHNHNKRGNDQPVLVPYHTESGIGKHVSFPAITLESALLCAIKEIKPQDVLPKSEKPDDTAVMTSKIHGLTERIEKLKSKLLTGDDEDEVLIDVIRKLQTQKKDLQADLQAARQAAANPLSEAWEEYATLFDLVKENEDDGKLKMRVIARRMIDRIDCFFSKYGRIRLAAIEVHFPGGIKRSLFVWHRPAYGLHGKKRPISWGYRSASSEDDYRGGGAGDSEIEIDGFNDGSDRQTMIGFPCLGERAKNPEDCAILERLLPIYLSDWDLYKRKD